ncbi:galactose-specific lectin nattectin-like [Nothobranchius furzeri]|nr:galactose-specific lectin nattectin-like [Nothobranchius furzeri]
MASGLLFLLLLGIGGNIYCEAQSDCPLDWTEYDNNCYQYEDQEKTWADAEAFCNQEGGDLTSIQNTDQYNFIRDLIVKGAGFNQKSWVGGTNLDTGGEWVWADGTPFTFTNWGPGEPNNQGGNEHCMDINLREQDYVNDEECTQELSFVCIKAI